MRLNPLEVRWIEELLIAELEVPFNAKVFTGRREINLVLVPTIDSDGYFVLNYYNASFGEGDLRPEVDLSQVIGIHPELYRAWTTGEDVTIQYRTNSHLATAATFAELTAKVGRVMPGNRGRLFLKQNIVRRLDLRLSSAEFCIVDFPDFRTVGKQWDSVSKVLGLRNEEIREIASDLGDNARIELEPVPHHIVLQSDDGWQITITTDEDGTRDLVSHTGQIEKINDDEFEEEELLHVLKVLKYFFAFASGTYCHYTTIVGYGPNAKPIWGMIGKFEGKRHRFTNWFGASLPMMDGTILEGLFPSFWRQWHAKEDELIAAIECYVHSNSMRRTGIPGDAVAKSYAGLEILAGLLSGQTIRYGGGDVVDAQLGKVGVPNQILCESINPMTHGLCKTLIQREKCGECCHGAHLLNDVRNYISHPLDPENPATIKQRFRTSLEGEVTPYFVLHDLSQFYLEYLLLGLCEFFIGEHRRLIETPSPGKLY